MAIFNCYVSSPEGICFGPEVILFFWIQDDPMILMLSRQVSCASVGSFAILCKWTVASTAQLGSVVENPKRLFRLFRLLQKPGMTWTLTMTAWHQDSMTQPPWGLGLCQWSEVHLPRRAVEQVEQYPKPSSFRRLKKGIFQLYTATLWSCCIGIFKCSIDATIGAQMSPACGLARD